MNNLRPSPAALGNLTPALLAGLTRDQIEQRVRELGDWFHNLDLNGVQTAPNHFWGDFPRVKWQSFARTLPVDLHGKSVLDLGCNSGFYSIEMKRRGASRVVGIDSDPACLEQARFAALVCGVELELRQFSVYQLAQLGEKFDIVLFLGMLDHLRHPLLALDLIHEHAAKDLLVLQSMHRGSDVVEPVAADHHFWETDIFERPGFPRMHFIEKKYAADPNKWWIPNRACTEAMLRSAGFEILQHPDAEVFLCRRNELPNGPHPFSVGRRTTGAPMATGANASASPDQSVLHRPRGSKHLPC
jgi:tRNA (mo5U34)-methyltransferase